MPQSSSQINTKAAQGAEVYIDISEQPNTRNAACSDLEMVLLRIPHASTLS